MGVINLTVAFEWIKSVKNASFVRGMFYLCPYNAVIALCRWHLLLFRGLLHHDWWRPENSLLICHLRGTAIDTLLLREDLAVWTLGAYSHWSWKAPSHVMRILGAENALRHFGQTWLSEWQNICHQWSASLTAWSVLCAPMVAFNNYWTSTC